MISGQPLRQQVRSDRRCHRHSQCHARGPAIGDCRAGNAQCLGHRAGWRTPASVRVMRGVSQEQLLDELGFQVRMRKLTAAGVIHNSRAARVKLPCRAEASRILEDSRGGSRICIRYIKHSFK